MREMLDGVAGLRVVGTAAGAAEALAQIDSTVDVALVDLGLGEESGAELIAALKHRLPHLNIMAHTVFDDRDQIFRALKAGAASYVLKGARRRALIDAIHELHAGGAPMSPSVARLVIQSFHLATSPDPITPRERQILRLIDRGLTYKEISASLSISVHTVHSHIKSMYERLQATGKCDALARARARGLL